MISRRKREREREGFSWVSLPTLKTEEAQRTEEKPRGKREREGEREERERERKGEIVGRFFFSLSFREKVERKEMKSVYRTSIF